jgi:hypothetical protein
LKKNKGGGVEHRQKSLMKISGMAKSSSCILKDEQKKYRRFFTKYF